MREEDPSAPFRWRSTSVGMTALVGEYHGIWLGRRRERFPPFPAIYGKRKRRLIAERRIVLRKIICFVLCFLLLISSALAEGAPKELKEDEPLHTSLYERSMELAGLFNEALHSEGYFSLLGTVDFEEPLRLLRMQDFTQPWSVSAVRADQAVKSPATDALPGELSKAKLSAALEETLRQKAYHGAANYLARQEGLEGVALSSAFALSDAYICPEEMDGPCFVVMHYGGLYAFLVTFYPTVNGTVTAQAQFIPSRSADELNLPAE